jgi:uncharacterized protein YdeI (YjbR/CyaY-like superfamily)
MIKKDSAVDEYIKMAPAFAKPILNHIREVLHKAFPDVEEKMLYNCPTFMFADSPLCSMLVYDKPYCALNLWKHKILKDPDKLLVTQSKEKGKIVGNLTFLESLKDLPSDEIIIGFINQVIELNKQGIKPPLPFKGSRAKEMEVPDYFQKELDKNEAAKKTFTNFKTVQRTVYLRWITTPKYEESRMNNVTKAIEWLAEGKEQNWNRGNGIRGRKKSLTI